MAGDKDPSEELLDAIVQFAVTPILKRIGFRKSARNYHRRLGEVVQVVNIQSSHGSSSSEKKFYVNVGLAFDEICRQRKFEILEKPRECECDERGQRWRLEHLYAETSASWTVGVNEENADANANK